MWKATTLSARAALVPDVAFVLPSIINMLRYWGTSSEVYGRLVYYWIAKNCMVTLTISLLFALAGNSAGRIASRFRRSA